MEIFNARNISKVPFRVKGRDNVLRGGIILANVVLIFVMHAVFRSSSEERKK